MGELSQQRLSLKVKIARLEPQVTHYDYMQNTSIARKLRRLKTELNFLEDYIANVQPR